MTNKIILVVLCALMYLVLFIVLFNTDFASIQLVQTMNNALLLVSTILLLQFYTMAYLLYFEKLKIN